jgi:Fe-S cluster assembly protein SufD
MVQTLADPRSLLEAITRRHSEPDWFVERRRKALEAYVDGALPDRVQHLWRYTDPMQFAPCDKALNPPSTQPSSGITDFPHTLRGLLARGDVSGGVLLDGSGHARIELSPKVRAKGVIALDFHQALAEKPDLVNDHLGRLVGFDVSSAGVGKFEALNLALWNAGMILYIPRDVQVEKPIHIWLSAPRSSSEAFFASRLLVIADEGSEVTVIDECEGGGDQLKLNAAVEIFAGPGSRVRYASVQRLNPSVTYNVTERAEVSRDAHLLTATASLGSRVTKSDVGSILSGPGTNVELFGFLFGEGRQHFDHHTVHDHRADHSFSNLDFKVVLKDRSRSAYTGLIRIEPNCPESQAYQENRNLLLNEGARAESIPELEILTDEVKCSHGATVGTLDAQHIFYLMSRGMDRAEAIRLIVGGFIEPTLSRLDTDLSERLRGHIQERVKDL